MTTGTPHFSDDPDLVTPALSRWLDGRSRPGEAQAIESRLASDPAFAAEVADFKASLAALRADRRTRPPEGLGDRVLARVASGGGEILRFERAARRYAVAAAVLLGIGVAGVAWTAGRSPASTGSSDAFAAVEAGRFDRAQRTELVMFAPDAASVDGR